MRGMRKDELQINVGFVLARCLDDVSVINIRCVFDFECFHLLFPLKFASAEMTLRSWICLSSAVRIGRLILTTHPSMMNVVVVYCLSLIVLFLSFDGFYTSSGAKKTRSNNDILAMFNSLRTTLRCV